ncbi:hypothetical protein DXB51_15550 [Bacillus cereus]|nr:hypothetical protein DXB51_15550 [Bacillus cereus]
MGIFRIQFNYDGRLRYISVYYMRRFSYNQHYIWFHVLEDEISHRGQIKMLKNKLFENYVK